MLLRPVLETQPLTLAARIKTVVIAAPVTAAVIVGVFILTGGPVSILVLTIIILTIALVVSAFAATTTAITAAAAFVVRVSFTI